MFRKLSLVGLSLLLVSPALGQSNRDRGARDDAPRGRGDDREMRRDQRGEQDERGVRGEEGRGGPGGFFRRPNPMFEALDADRDGMISTAELKKAIVALKKLDADGDGNITLEEASPAGGPGGFFGGDPAGMVDRMFEENDANNDGKLSRDEIPERMQRMVQGADADNDGAISKEEMAASMENMRNRFGGGQGGFGRGNFGGGAAGGANLQGMMQQFAQFDLDRNGKLTRDEVPDQMRRMLMAAGADANSDGGVDAGELRDAVQRMAGQAAQGGNRSYDRNFGRGGENNGRSFGRGDDGDDRGARGRRDSRNGDDDEGADDDRRSRGRQDSRQGEEERPTQRTRGNE